MLLPRRRRLGIESRVIVKGVGPGEVVVHLGNYRRFLVALDGKAGTRRRYAWVRREDLGPCAT